MNEFKTIHVLHSKIRHHIYIYIPTTALMLRYNDIRVVNLYVSAFFGHLHGGIQATEIHE